MPQEIKIEGIGISPDVLTAIVSRAVTDVEGIASVGVKDLATNLVSMMLSSKAPASEPAVEAEVIGDKLALTVRVVVFFGYPFKKLAEAVRAAWARNGVRVREISDIVDGRVTGDDSADIVLGTPEAWLAQWRLLALARERGTIVVDAACAAEFRAVTGSRELPPFAASGAGRAWLVEPGTPARRVRLPGA